MDINFKLRAIVETDPLFDSDEVAIRAALSESLIAILNNELLIGIDDVPAIVQGFELVDMED